MSHSNLFISKNARKFLSTKRSLKPIYGLNLGNLSILRYILDCIENNCSKIDKLQTRLYQGQIAAYCHCSPKTVRDHIKLLIRKKFIKYNAKLSTFSLGKVLTTSVNFTYPLDIGKNYLSPRCREILPISISSKHTKGESCYAPVDNQSTSYKEQKIKRSTKEVALSNIVEIRNKLCKINT